MPDSVFFEPRIGSRYLDGWQGYRTLVLGAHHVCTLDCPHKAQCMTAEGVRAMDAACPVYADFRDSAYHRLHRANIVEMNAYIDCEAGYPTYDAFTHYMLEQKTYLHPAERARLWDSVVFYNFLQHYLPSGDTPPYQGHEAMYDAALPALKAMISALPAPPEVIYVWSKPVRDCLMANAQQMKGLRVESLEEYPQFMVLYYFSYNTAVTYSHAWVEQYLAYRLDKDSYVEPRDCPVLADVLHRALCQGFLSAEDGRIVIGYAASRHRSAAYGTFLQMLHSKYRMAWKDIAHIITKLAKDGQPQRQNLRALPVLTREEKAYDYVRSLFQL